MLRDELFRVISFLFLSGIIGGAGASGEHIMATMRISIGSTLLLVADAERDFEVSTGYTQLLKAANKKRDRDFCEVCGIFRKGFPEAIQS